MGEIFEEENGDERGAVCPYCGERNIGYEGTCKHYAGYFNVSECAWELEGPIMSKIQQVLEKEFEHISEEVEKIEEEVENNKSSKKKKLEKLQEIIDEGLGEYETNRLREICPSAAYADDEEEYSIGPKDFAYSVMIFLDKKGVSESKKYLSQIGNG